MRTVSAGDANRRFSSLLREVASGQSITILSRGKPVALLCPAPADEDRREAARRVLVERLRGQRISGGRNWTRDELYED